MKLQFLICIVMHKFFIMRGEKEFTLTTAFIKQSTSAKPTTMFRRLNVERFSDITSNNSLDFFKLIHQDAKKNRRAGSEIWNWDYWCQMQPRSGNCSKKITKYYYDTQLDQCQPFVFTGCNSNKNSFKNIIECERHCKALSHSGKMSIVLQSSCLIWSDGIPGASYMALRQQLQSDSCKLQPSSGLCLGLLPKYYYDVNDMKCKPFTYGGCGGNGNRFDTMRKCARECGG